MEKAEYFSDCPNPFTGANGLKVTLKNNLNVPLYDILWILNY